MSSKKINVKKIRRSFTAEQKAEILVKHFKENVQASDLCDAQGLTPSAFFNWKNQALSNLTRALTPDSHKIPNREKQLEEKILKLEAKLVKKDHVIAEISEDIIALKKKLGEL
jgi:transposase